MSHSLAVAKPPVFASFRGKGSRSSARPSEAEGSTVEHRLDLLMDRLDRLEFTVSRLFDTDTDGHEDDRLAQIETRLHAMHDQLAALRRRRSMHVWTRCRICSPRWRVAMPPSAR